jgi:hypothetical protein
MRTLSGKFTLSSLLQLSTNNLHSALAALGNEDAGEAGSTSNAADESAADTEAKPSE